jgi:hypothetical protein
MECDSCNREMSDKEFQKAVTCRCDICSPWTVCDYCHDQIKIELRTRRKDLV